MKLIGYIVFAFLATSLFAQDFDPLDPDYEKLNNLVIEYLNTRREKKGKEKLEQNAALQKTAQFYTDHLVLRKFEKSQENKLRIKTKIRRYCEQNGYNKKFVDFSIATFGGIKYFGRNFYRDAGDSTSSLHLFYGKNKPSRKDKEREGFRSEPLKKYTYHELAAVIANKFMHDEGHFKTLNNAYTRIGISCVVEPRSLGGRKLPKIKAIIIVGGKLINW